MEGINIQTKAAFTEGEQCIKIKPHDVPSTSSHSSSNLRESKKKSRKEGRKKRRRTYK